MPRECIVVRVFATGEAGGNHLGVISDIDGLDSAAMQAIAVELGFSESVFIEFSPSHPPHVRIFTPGDELPFAGHPLVGTAWVLNEMGNGAVDTLHCQVGDVAISEADGLTWIETSHVGKGIDPGDAANYVARSGIHDVVGVNLVMMPLEYVLAELLTFEAVGAASVDMDAVGERFGLMVWSRLGGQVKARFFAPGSGVNEDPATGSAAVALASVFVERGESSGAIEISQGAEIGYPSTIRLNWGDGLVAIGGSVIHDETRILDT